MGDIGDIIVEVAKEYIGEREIPGNQGFLDSKFQAAMEGTGWTKGDAWCAFFAELVWRTAYNKAGILIDAELNKLFSASAVATLANFKKAPDFIFSKTPTRGALCIWQHYSNGASGWEGHIGIVDEFTLSTVTTIDGNTNVHGGREGIEVGRVLRRMNFGAKDGLVLQGFILPRE